MSAQQFDAVIVGTSIAGLVAARCLIDGGLSVAIAGDRTSAGGTFAGIDFEGVPLAVGPRFLELGYEDEPVDRPELNTYIPSVGGHRKFVGYIRDFITGHTPIREIDSSCFRIRRGAGDFSDFIFTASLDSLVDILTASERTAALSELRDVVDQRGGSPVFGPGDTFESASLANHGRTVHSLIVEPLRVKTEGQRGRTLAPYARKLWLSVMHPGTLLDVFDGRNQFLPRRQFATPVVGVARFISEFVDGLAQDGVSFLAPVEAVLNEGRSFRIDGGSLTHSSRTLILSAPPTSLIGSIADGVPKFRVSLVWCQFDEGFNEAPLIVHDLSPDGPFRISRDPSHANIACLEYGGSMAKTGASLRAPQDAMRLLGICSEPRVILSKSVAVPLYSSHLVRAQVKIAERWEGCPGIYRTGVLAAPGADSFNEQVIQGLSVASDILERGD